MFEYLMPNLFLPEWEHTLIGQTNRHVVEAQKARARDGMPWGISESGYYAFDMQMNYQYRAFGLSEAALRGERQESVIAPYASVLALSVDPQGGRTTRASSRPPISTLPASRKARFTGS